MCSGFDKYPGKLDRKNVKTLKELIENCVEPGEKFYCTVSAKLENFTLESYKVIENTKFLFLKYLLGM